jgi:cytochrome c
MKHGAQAVFIAAMCGWAALAASSAGAFSKAQSERGSGIYAAKCASCHGEHMEGGDHGPPLQDSTFWSEWQGKPARALYSRILSTMPTDDPGSLSETDVIDVVAHLIVSSGATTGDKTVRQAGELNAITLETPPAASR